MDSIAMLFKKKEYYHAYQPICKLPEKGRLGYEALLRNTAGVNPESLFQLAKEEQRLPELDTQSLYHAVSAFFRSSEKAGNDLLFVNLFPSTIVEESFPLFVEEIVRAFSPFLNRIVIEINESIMDGEVWNEPLFAQRIAALREKGFQIAFDDVGDGTPTFRKILEISPDFIKIDRYFSKDLSISKEKQKVIRLFVDFCKDNTQLILEGVEDEADFACATLLGVVIGQGYLFGRPERLSDQRKRSEEWEE